jgi:hypothetical protein
MGLLANFHAYVGAWSLNGSSRFSDRRTLMDFELDVVTFTVYYQTVLNRSSCVANQKKRLAPKPKD